jgi:hypothetical protein
MAPTKVADPAAYPPPGGQPGWNKPGVTKILANPKYTGHMVFGRTRKTGDGRSRPVPPEQWIWTPQPVHPVIIDRPIWEQAQKIGGDRGNVRDPETLSGRRSRRYVLRSRIRCRACQRRMCGTWRASATGTVYIYYRCPHNPSDPRHIAAHPDHGPVSVREDTMLGALSQFFDTYVFGHDRADLLTELLPASDADHAEAQARPPRPTAPASASASPSCTPSAPPPRPGSPNSRPRPRTTTIPSCSTPCPSRPGSWTVPRPGSRRTCWPRSRSRPSTTTTTARSRSAPPAG